METLLTQNYLFQLSPILGLILSLSVMAFKFELHKKVRINDEKGILLPSALNNKEEEFLRNVMAIRADEAIIEVDLCILFFLVKYFSKLQQTEIQKLKTYFQWKYKKLKEQESEILNNLTLDQSPKYYHVYSNPK